MPVGAITRQHMIATLRKNLAALMRSRSASMQLARVYSARTCSKDKAATADDRALFLDEPKKMMQDRADYFERLTWPEIFGPAVACLRRVESRSLRRLPIVPSKTAANFFVTRSPPAAPSAICPATFAVPSFTRMSGIAPTQQSPGNERSQPRHQHYAPHGQRATRRHPGNHHAADGPGAHAQAADERGR
jgi:hypothetical protein